MVKSLFDFVPRQCMVLAVWKPTCVVAEARNQQVRAVYLSSEAGFDNYCRECPELLMVQETNFRMFTLRVFCSQGKCIK